MPIRFSLQVRAGGAVGGVEGLVDLCRRAEAAGFEEVRVADHPGSTHDPFALLAYVAAHTSTIRVGTYVLNMGVRHPIDVAIGALTVADVSAGRFTLGVGAGHTPQEWEARGLTQPDPQGRVDRLIEAVSVLPELLAGQEVACAGEHFRLARARIDQPTVVDGRIPLLVGGTNPRLVDLAARRADVVALTGLGRTKADGHGREVNWSPEATSRSIERIEHARGNRRPVIDALVQLVDPEPHREASAESLAGQLGSVAASDLLDCPFALLGAVDAIADQVQRNEDRWGITSYCVRPPAFEHIEAVIDRLG